MIERYLRPKDAFWILILLAFMRGVLYTIAVPPWQHPDEPTHFEHLRFIAETNRLPTAEDFSIPLRWEIAESMKAEGFWDLHTPVPVTEETLSKPGTSAIGIYTFTHPRLYYIVAGLWLKPWLGLPIEAQVYIVRLFSVILNLIIVAAAYFSGKCLFPAKKWLPVAVMAFIVFHPVQTDIMSAVNNDSLINAIGALFFFVTALIFRRGLSLIKFVVILLLLVLGILSKTTVLVLIAAFPIGAIFYLWRMGYKNSMLALIFVVLLFVVAALILNQIEGPDQWIKKAIDIVGKFLRVNIAQTLESLSKPEHQILVVYATPVVFQSFWAVFGWRSVWVTPVLYWLAGVLSVVAVGGLIKFAYQWFHDKRRQFKAPFLPSFMVFMAFTVLITIFITLTRSLMVQGMNPYLSHGRYSLISMIPISLLIILGLSAWVPRDRLKVAGIAYVAFLVLFDAVSFWGFLVPAYY